MVSGVDGVVSEPLVEPAQQGAVDRRLDAVPPGRAEQDDKKALVQLVHGVVVGLELGRAGRVGVGDHLADLAGDAVGDLRHVPDDGGQFVGHRRGRMAAQSGLRDVLGQVSHPLQVRGDV